MKTSVLVLSGLLSLPFISFAQSGKYPSKYTQRETVIMNGAQEGNTTIEINSDGVFLNGEQVASRAELNNKNLEKKIIIRNSTKDRSRNYDEYYNSGREKRTEGRALLGVFTDTRRSVDGAYIDRVSPNSAAADAGLRSGDIILNIDSVNIYSAEDLTNTIRHYRPQDRVTITYKRSGKERQTTAILGAAQEPYWSHIEPMPPFPPSFPTDENLFHDSKPRLGVSVEHTPDGVRISAVRKGSVAETADLRAGDVITYLDDKKVERIEEVQEIVNNVRPGSRLKIEVDRNGKRITRTATFPQTRDTRDL